MIFNMVGGGGTVVPVSLNISGIKTAYKEGDKIDLTGLVATVILSNGKQKDVTDQVAATPAAGTTVTPDTTRISFRWVWPNDDSVVLVQDISITSKAELSSIKINAPAGRSYYKGGQLNLSGFTVIATYTSGRTADVTANSSFSPTNGTTLTAYGTQKITATYSENGVTKTDSVTVTVTPKLVTWGSGSDSEIAEMIKCADDGIINLSNYWSVGDTRSVSLASSSRDNQTSCELVIMDWNTSPVKAPGVNSHFIVGLKNSLYGCGAPSTYDKGYSETNFPNVCTELYNRFSSTIKGLFKQMRISSEERNGYDSKSVNVDCYLVFPSEMEVFGAATNAFRNSGTQIAYYKTSANRSKITLGSGGKTSYNSWFLRDIGNMEAYWPGVAENGKPTTLQINNTSYSDYCGYSPFGIM